MQHPPKDSFASFADGLISQHDLQMLGMNNVGYVRAAIIRGETAFVLHAADGTALAVKGSTDDIQAIAAEHAIGVVALH